MVCLTSLSIRSHVFPLCALMEGIKIIEVGWEDVVINWGNIWKRANRVQNHVFFPPPFSQAHPGSSGDSYWECMYQLSKSWLVLKTSYESPQRKSCHGYYYSSSFPHMSIVSIKTTICSLWYNIAINTFRKLETADNEITFLSYNHKMYE